MKHAQDLVATDLTAQIKKIALLANALDVVTE